MVKLKLIKNFKNRYTKFLSSELFENQPSAAKTKYWEHHAKKIKYSIVNDEIDLLGKSGFDIPDSKNSFNFHKQSLKTFIKKLLNIDQMKLETYRAAFSQVINDNSIKGFQQTNFDGKRILASSYSDCKKIYPFKYEINSRILLSYYFLNILNSYIDFSKIKFIVEIGAGSGNLLSLLKYHNKAKCIIDIDLPETLIHCIPFLTTNFPNCKFLLPNEINDKISNATLSKYDFIFITPKQINLLENDTIDLFINIQSFQEMEFEQIKDYFNLIQRTATKESYFLNHNRVEKIPYDAEKSETSLRYKYKPVRFFDYPFFDNEVLIYEICRIFELVQRNPMYLRLEKIKK